MPGSSRSAGWECAANRFCFYRLRSGGGRNLPDLAGQSDHRALGRPDPATVEGPLARHVDAFRSASRALENRIKLFVSLPLDKLDRMAVKHNLDEIGRIEAAREASQ
jgi:arsenate reductase